MCSDEASAWVPKPSSHTCPRSQEPGARSQVLGKQVAASSAGRDGGPWLRTCKELALNRPLWGGNPPSSYSGLQFPSAPQPLRRLSSSLGLLLGGKGGKLDGSSP